MRSRSWRAREPSSSTVRSSGSTAERRCFPGDRTPISRPTMTTTALSIESGALAAPQPCASGVRAYKGIPYAAPPVGQLRWRPPQPVAPWNGVRSAEAFGPNSLQGVVFDDIDPTVCGASEDCLTLNVWTPASPGSSDRLPERRRAEIRRDSGLISGVRRGRRVLEPHLIAPKIPDVAQRRFSSRFSEPDAPARRVAQY